jgi:hypothetical protein
MACLRGRKRSRHCRLLFGRDGLGPDWGDSCMGFCVIAWRSACGAQDVGKVENRFNSILANLDDIQ